MPAVDPKCCALAQALARLRRGADERPAPALGAQGHFLGTAKAAAETSRHALLPEHGAAGGGGEKNPDCAFEGETAA